MYQRILVPFDGSATSSRGLDEAIGIATLTGASLRLIHMLDMLDFTSGFETWNDTLPTDWYGSKSTLDDDSVLQVASDVHGGTYAVRLRNGSETSHKRFTTQPTTVVNGTIYTIDEQDYHPECYEKRETGPAEADRDSDRG